MYVTVQFIILEILLGLIFLVILYFMVRELLKKIIRRELREIKEPLQVLANYLVEASRQGQDDDNPEGPEGPDNLGNVPGGKGPLPTSSPEKLPEEPVDIADEFVQLKNTNRISAYNIRVQKIWDLYKQNKITLHQYKAELLRLKKEFDIARAEDEDDDDRGEKKAVKSTGGVKVEPLTPTPSASPKEKVKNIDTEPSPTTPDKDGAGKQADSDTPDPKEDNNKDIDIDIQKGKGNKAASL